MSRIGNAPVAIPSGVDVTVADRTVTVKGPKGSLTRAIPGDITITQDDGTLTFDRPNEERKNKALHGLTRSLVNNMVVGVPRATRRTSRSSASAIGPRRRVRTHSASTSASAIRSTCRPPRASRSRCRFRPR